VRWPRVEGSLAPFAEGFAADLAGQGYSPLSAANLLRLMAHLSRWLDAERLEPADLDSGRAEGFLAERRRLGYVGWLSGRGLAPMLGYLRGLGVVPLLPCPGPVTAEEVLLGRFRGYLTGERGVTVPVAARYVSVVRPFTAGRAARLGEVTAAEVSGFVTTRCAGSAVWAAKELVTALRSLLRWLHLEGMTAAGLDAAVPPAAGKRSSGLPKGLPGGQVTALLASCDRQTAAGRRDFAVLTVMARLGLRAAETAALDLDDIGWRAGELLVRGKGRRDERLPLPADVGEAIAGYLHGGRPGTGGSRAVFVRSCAPHGGLSAGGVGGIMRQACVRAGLPVTGAHRLRHSAGTAMLRAGAPLAEVGQVLRHRSAETTAIYAKVDDSALRQLARPWPVTP
jgi:integrase/recombinase XerD